MNPPTERSNKPPVTVDSVLGLVGNTPLVRLKRLVNEREAATIWGKCEFMNPGGSIKDRIAFAMIEAAEREGLLEPGKSTLVEPTSGNTGIGLALVGRALGMARQAKPAPSTAAQAVAGGAGGGSAEPEPSSLRVSSRGD